MTARVTVLIPNYNGRELLDRLIPTLLAQTYSDRELMLLDDASTDGSPEHVAERWPEIHTLVNRANRGFAANVNRGIRASESRYIAIINTDVELEPEWLGELVRTLDSHPDAGSATGKALMMSDRGVLDGAGNQMRWSGAATRRGHGVRDAGQYDEPGEVISACAGFAVYRRAAFEAVGLFDEDLIAYYEDVDWGLRAQLAGFRCRYEPRAVAYHVGRATHGRDALYTRLERRNQLVVICKCFPARVLLRQAPRILLGQLVLILRSIATNTFAAQMLAYVDFARVLPRTLIKRAELRRERRDGFARVAALITPGRAERRPRTSR
jgi:GT2 family glycosyltransferase